MQQLGLFGDDAVTTTPAPAPADVQLSLFRPNALDMRAPRKRGQRDATAAEIRPDLHTDTLYRLPAA